MAPSEVEAEVKAEVKDAGGTQLRRVDLAVTLLAPSVCQPPRPSPALPRLCLLMAEWIWL